MANWFTRWFRGSKADNLLMSHMTKVLHGKLDKATAQKLLTDLVAAGGNEAEMNRILREYADAAVDQLDEAAQAALRGADEMAEPGFLSIAAIVKRGPPNGEGPVIGFNIPELDGHFQRWKKANKNNLTPGELTPERYIQSTVPGKRPHTILSALLGPGRHGVPVRAPRTKQPGKYWHKFFPRPVHGREEPEALVAFIADSRKTLVIGGKQCTPLEAKIHEVYMMRYPGATAPDHVVETLKNYLKQHSGEVQKDALGWVLAENLDDFGEDALLLMIGNQKLDRTELVHRVMDAYEILESAAQATGRTGTEELWDIPGVHGLVQKVVSRSGHEKGYVFELEMIMDAADEGIGALALQVKIGNKDGPDMLVLIGDRAFVKQAKSYESHYPLLGAGGEMVRQTGSDLRRIFHDNIDDLPARVDQGLVIKVPVARADGSMHVELRAIGNVWEFLIDEKRLWMKRFQYGDEVDLAEQVSWLNHAKDQVNNSMVRINYFLKSEVKIDTPDGEEMLDEIFEGTDEFVGTTGFKLKDLIEMEAAHLMHARGGEAVSIRELMMIRMLIDPRRGTLDPDLLQRLLAMDPALEIKPTFKVPEIEFYEGPWWGPKDIGNAHVDESMVGKTYEEIGDFTDDLVEGGGTP